jgi:hypothetical protein
VADLAGVGLWTLTMLGLVVLVWLDQLLRQTGRPELVVLNPTAFAPVLGAVSTATSGRWWPAAAQRTRWAGSYSPWGCRSPRRA